MDLKRDQKRRPVRIKKFFAGLVKKMIFMAIFAGILGFIGWVSYYHVKPIREILDRMANLMSPVILEYGWLPVIGGILLLFGAAWAIVEEQSEKEHRRQIERERTW